MRMLLKIQRLTNVMHKKDQELDQLENLTSTVSHEMRTPLGIILQISERMAGLVLSGN